MPAAQQPPIGPARSLHGTPAKSRRHRKRTYRGLPRRRSDERGIAVWKNNAWFTTSIGVSSQGQRVTLG